MKRQIALMIAGLLAATSAFTGSALAEEGAKPITPAWTMEDVVQQMRDEYQGGTVMPEERTGQIREFNLRIAEFTHEITDGVKVKAWGFGFEGQPVSVPGPALRAKQGDLVRIHLKNETDQPHSLHSHGITSVDEVNDGVPHVTGAYIMPGETFTYQFVASEAGTHWYHCHVQTSLHQDMGMYGALIIEEAEKPTWDREFVMMVDEWDTHRDPADAVTKPTWNYFVVNGKAGKSVPDMIIPEGEIARIRLINAGFESHALHLHGTHFVITHKDGYQLPLPQRADTLNIAPGETYDLLVKGRDGLFPWHDHNSLAVTDDGVYPGGMLMHTRGSAARRFDPDQAFTPLPLEGEIHNQSHHPGDEGHVIDHDDHVMPVPKNGAAPVVTQGAVVPETTFGQAVPFDPMAPLASVEAAGGRVVAVKLEARRVRMEVAPGDAREVWSFNGQVPAPTIRVRQGDTVRITLTNKDPEMEHGLDFHAGQMDSGTFHKAIQPGESITFDYVARYPGVFYYHCSAGPVIMHIANGMFGAMIVDPPDYTPAGTEYVLVQHEWYDPAGGLEALLTGQPTSVVLNGVAAQYVDDPLTARAGEKVRFYFVNAGANNFASFHVIGEIFDAVWADGNPRNLKRGVQSVTVPPGGAVVTELVAAAGSYPVLTHSLGDATAGALGILQVQAVNRVTVLYNGLDLSGSARLEEGRTYVSAAAFAAAARVDYAYDPGSGRVMVAGKEIAADASGHAWVRELAAAVGASVSWDGSSWTVVVMPVR